MRNILKFILLFVFIFLSWRYGKILGFDSATLFSFFHRMPVVVSAVLFILCYVGITFVAWLAKDLLKIVAAIIFGAYGSTLLIWIAEIMNAFLLFTLSRYLGRDFVEKHLLKGSAARIDQRLGKVSAIELFFLRALPVIPFRFLDVAVGLTKIPFYFYLIAVVVASPLRIFWVQYIIVGVGDSLFKDPGVLVTYLMENTQIFIVSFVYLIISLVVIIYFQFFRIPKGENHESL